MQFLELFDAANPCDCYQRTASVLPQQALAMSNSELAQREGRSLAGRLAAEGMTDENFIVAAFEQVLGRTPTAPERTASLNYFARQRQLFVGAGLRPVALGPSADASLRVRENFVQVLLNHNDFVTVR
jgi:hypothetical protein